MISLLIAIVVLGFIAWLVTSIIPMPPPFPQIVIAVCAIIALLYVLQAFGVWHGFGHV